MDVLEILVIAVINVISLSKFRDGGAAIFVAENKNHHMVIVGRKDIMPFIKNILRVELISYEMLAREKRADEDKPWAIIIRIAPVNPQ